MTKNIKDAKMHRESQVILFEGACEDLVEEIGTPGEGNVRRLKIKMKLVESSYLACIEAQSEVVVMEKTSSADENNRNWVKTNLRKPYKEVMGQADNLLDTLGAENDPEKETKVQAAEIMRDLKCKLASFEATIGAMSEGLSAAVSETNIWLKDNHAALTESVNKVNEDITKKHLEMGGDYIRILGDTEVDAEVTRQEKFRADNVPLLAKLRAKLLSKTPAQVGAVQQQVLGGGVQAVYGKGEENVSSSRPQLKSKFKMAALPIPKFSGKIVDYPEWKKLFRECVESQYEESATVMILRSQALPDSLSGMVPRCTDLDMVWEKLDKKYLDPTRVWKGVKTDLESLDRSKLGDSRYMVALVNKIMDAESLLDTVGMVHWLRQEDKIPQYEDMLSKSEKLEWVRMKPRLTGTPWENFKSFLVKMRDEYEEISKTGTVELEEEKEYKSTRSLKCDFCKKFNHTEKDCRMKKAGNHQAESGKKKCWKCGSENHLSRDCTVKVDQSNNMVKDRKTKKKAEDSHSADGKTAENQLGIFSNYLRTKDCRWCGRTYNSPFSCSGCGKQWAAKTTADHCLAHCAKYSAASAKERGELVIKGDNCLICLHHEHTTDSCFGKDQQRTLCGMDGCSKRHHPSLHSAPQSSVQAVQTARHVQVEGGDITPGVEGEDGEIIPGVEDGDELTISVSMIDNNINTSALAQTGMQGKFLSRVLDKKVLTHRISWSDACWTGEAGEGLEADRVKELEEMRELLKLPLIEGNKVLLLIQSIKVKYGPRGDKTDITVFWDDGSTCSLVLSETADRLGCPGEPVTVSIDTVNGVVTRDTKLYCVELLNNSGDRVVVKAFGVEKISDVRNVVQLSTLKDRFSGEVQSQWGKLSTRPHGHVHLLVGQEYAGYHPVKYEALGNLVVCRTMFGQGWLLTGSGDGLQAEDCTWGEEVAALRVGRITVVTQSNHRIAVNTVRLTYTQERDYYTLDDLGIVPPRRCPNCKGCTECSWRGQKLSKQEAFELEYIEKCVEFEEGKIKVKFPFLVDPHELANNYHQVVRIAESEERKLEKEGRMNQFNELFQKLQDLGAVEEISEHELRSWKGPCHYVSLQHVVDEDSATTSFRIVSNSSLKTPGNPHSLNSILAKGPNMLSDPYKIMIRLRTYLRGLNSDVTKAYYQMLTSLLEKHVRRIVWRNGVKGARWRIFGYLCVSFGDTPAAALLEVCFRIVISKFGSIDLVAAHRLLNDRFVDDITTGGDVEQVTRFKGVEDPVSLSCDGTMPQILGQANLLLKAIAISGEPDGGALEKLSGSVLGHGYSTERDELTVKFRVNVSPRRRGNVTGPDINRDTLGQLDQAVLTRRILLGVCNGQFDMLGVASPVTIKMKAAMRDLFIKENNLDWDTLLPEGLRDIWVAYMEELVQAGQLVFRRCVKPEGEIEEFWLVVFFDGSDQAYAGVVYCRWIMKDGRVVVRLLCSKSRVSPLRRISTPRGELNGAVVCMRLVWTVVQSWDLEERPTRILIAGDSETVLAAREKACGALGEYFGNRIAECWDLQERIEQLVPVGMTGQGEWYHLPSKDNAADVPTRLDSMVADIGIGSEWQDGKKYLHLPFSDWSWERDFADRKVTDVVPREELTAKYRGLAAVTKAVTEETNIILEKFDNGFMTNDYDILIKKTEPYFRWSARVRAKRMTGLLTLTSREMAVRFWFRICMDSTRAAKASGKLRELTLQEEQGMLVIRGRAMSGLQQLLGAEFLPVVMACERIATLIMLKSHEKCDHKSVDITLATSRRHCWIVGGRRLSKTICKLCVRCRYLRKREETQKMAPLADDLCVPSPAFSHLAVDFAGPYRVSSMLKSRGTRRGTGTMKVWALLVVCLNTRAMRIYLVPGYSTQDFLVTWAEVESECGIPRRVHSDRGSQLVSAAGALEALDYDWELISNSSHGQTVWQFCPSGAQWRNGAVEAMVKQFKYSLGLYKESGLNYAELQSLFKRISSVLNSRPVSARYGPRHVDSDPDYLEIITPNMMLTARSGIDLPLREYEDDYNPGKRLAYKEELERSWWEQWKVQCFDSLLPTKAWNVEKRGVKVGDVVLISYSDKSKTGTYKLGIVELVEVDEDGLVRTCKVAYRLVRSDMPAEDMRIYFKGLKYKKLRVPIQRLCVILPVEEQEDPPFLRKNGETDIFDKDGSDHAVEAVSKIESAGVEEVETQAQCDGFGNSIEDFDAVKLNDVNQVWSRQVLVANFRKNVGRKVGATETYRSVMLLHRDYETFENIWSVKVGVSD